MLLKHDKLYLLACVLFVGMEIYHKLLLSWGIFFQLCNSTLICVRFS